jgi:multiple sugar transport system permease protein
MNPLISDLTRLGSAIGIPAAWVPLFPVIVILAAVYAVLALSLTLLVRNGRATRRAAGFWLFVSPWVIGFVTFTLGPMVYAAYISFTKWTLLTPPAWVGFGNYTAALHDPLLRQAFKVTLIYAAISVPMQVVLCFLVAVLMNTKVRGIRLLRTIWYLPSLVTGVPQIVLFLFIFNPEYGLANEFLAKFGIHGPAWFASPGWAVPTVALMGLWTIGGNTMLLYLAGLQDVPRYLYEAVAIDGGGRIRQFWHVTVPLMTPVVLFNLITQIIIVLQTFTQAYVVTHAGEGPSNSLLFYVYYLYENAFINFNMGYASALAWILFIFIMILTVIVFRSSAAWVFYETEERRQRERNRLRLAGRTVAGHRTGAVA